VMDMRSANYDAIRLQMTSEVMLQYTENIDILFRFRHVESYVVSAASVSISFDVPSPRLTSFLFLVGRFYFLKIFYSNIDSNDGNNKLS